MHPSLQLLCIDNSRRIVGRVILYRDEQKARVGGVVTILLLKIEDD